MTFVAFATVSVAIRSTRIGLSRRPIWWIVSKRDKPQRHRFGKPQQNPREAVPCSSMRLGVGVRRSASEIVAESALPDIVNHRAPPQVAVLRQSWSDYSFSAKSSPRLPLKFTAAATISKSDYYDRDDSKRLSLNWDADIRHR
jgi:hypothetical protein